MYETTVELEGGCESVRLYQGLSSVGKWGEEVEVDGWGRMRVQTMLMAVHVHVKKRPSSAE